MNTYNSVDEIPVSNSIGYLYIFDASNYDNDITVKLENTIKLGMTQGCIKTRLNQYKTDPKHISFINCSEPSKRERILKCYIKEKLNIEPLIGIEYFNYNRSEIEKVILYFALCEVEIINKYYDLYNTDELKKWFDTVKIDDINTETNNTTQLPIFKCEFCKATFALKRTLATHLKTSKKCIRNRPKFNLNCLWCKSIFNSKDNLEKHHKNCEADKNILYIQSLEEVKNKDNIIKEKEKEIERLNNIIKEVIGKINNKK